MSKESPSSTTGRRAGLNRTPEQRFSEFNTDRLNRMLSVLPPRQARLVRVLPLLFHVNHALLPGYVSQDTPAGLVDYSPDKDTLAAARQLARTFTHEDRIQRLHPILGLYLMGSPGTIAWTRDSDLDIWLVHAGNLEAEAVERLAEKARRIEAHAAEMGLEMHFFVMDADIFRGGETLALSAESSGSSQHFLLLDEFYRSGLLLAGLKPLWWCVPPSDEHHYSEYVAEAQHSRKLGTRGHVDFGGLERIPADEFFGATVWQLYKSIESPYKSVMKLLLMEAYAADYPSIEQLLSHRHKRALLEGDLPFEALDPYIAMYRRVEEYLQSHNDEPRLRVLRRAFYLKVEERLSQPPEQNPPGWRREVLESMVRRWGWAMHELLHLDQRSRWKIDNAIEERRDIVKALQKSYAALSDFARAQGGDSRISELDLTVLGRKLYAAFDRKPNKLEIVTRGLCSAPEEPELSLHQLNFERTGAQWTLFKGQVGLEEAAQRQPLHRAASLVEVLAWCYFNRLSDAATVWHLFNGPRRQSPLGVRKVLEALEETYPDRGLLHTEMEDFARSPRVRSAQFMLNIGVEQSAVRMPEATVLTSNRSDAFQFGGHRTNLVGAVDLVVQTSWQELFSIRSEGPESVAAAVCEYLNRTERGPVAGPVAVPGVHCFEPHYGHTIVQRMSRLLREVQELVTQVDARTTCVHVLRMADHYYDIAIDQRGARYRAHATLSSLLRALGEATGTFMHVRFDADCAPDSPLPLLYQENRRGWIQTYALVRSERIDVYILDEQGNLLHYAHPDTDPLALFGHLRYFFEKTSRRTALAENATPLALEFKTLQRNAQGGYTTQVASLANTQRRSYLSLRLYADVDFEGRSTFTAYLDDREFSTTEYGNGLFSAIAQAVMAMRASRGNYPVYLTDLELSERLRQARDLQPHQTLEVLRQKLRIEQQLWKALAAAPR